MVNMIGIIKAHALKQLTRPVALPSKTLAVGTDETHKSIPILIFNHQYLTQPAPTISKEGKSYEDNKAKGSGAVLSLEDFETENFHVGHPFGGEF